MKAAGALLIIFAIIMGVVPQFTDCQSQGRALTLTTGRTVPMKCHWTAVSEIALAGTLLVVGASIARSKRKEALRPLSMIGGLLSVFAVLMPTVLIGVCAGNEMLCNILMKPTLIFSGVLSAAICLVVFILTMPAAARFVAIPQAKA